MADAFSTGLLPVKYICRDETLFCRLYNHPIEMVHLMLDDLRCPAGEFLSMPFPAAVQIFHLNVFITDRLSDSGEGERQPSSVSYGESFFKITGLYITTLMSPMFTMMIFFRTRSPHTSCWCRGIRQMGVHASMTPAFLIARACLPPCRHIGHGLPAVYPAGPGRQISPVLWQAQISVPETGCLSL